MGIAIFKLLSVTFTVPMVSLKCSKMRGYLLSFLGAFSVILFGVLAPALTYAEPGVPGDPTKLTFEQQMDTQVTSV